MNVHGSSTAPVFTYNANFWVKPHAESVESQGLMGTTPWPRLNTWRIQADFSLLSVRAPSHGAFPLALLLWYVSYIMYILYIYIHNTE